MAASTIDRSHSEQVEILRVSCIIFVVFIHAQPPWEYGQVSTDAIRYFYTLTNYGIFRGAVPTLSVISGYLFFNRFSYSRYLPLVRKKSVTVLLPAVLWAAGAAFSILIAQKLGTLQPKKFNFIDSDNIAFMLVDAVFGIENGPINLPIYFLYDIFICILVSPLMYYVMKRWPWLGCASLIAIWFSGLNIYTSVRGDILFGFYIGGLLAIRNIDLSIPCRLRYVFIGVFLFSCGLFSIHAGRLPVGMLETGVDFELNLLRLLSPLAMWSYASLVVRTAYGRFLAGLGSAAFFIYCAHGPLMRLIGDIYFKSLHDDVPYLLFYVGAPIAAVLLAVLMSVLLGHISPQLLSILSGGRLGLGYSAVRRRSEFPQ